MRPRAVITGAAGFIGSHLTHALLERGHEVVGVDALTDYYSPGLKRGNLADLLPHSRFHFLQGDLNELNLVELLRPGDIVYHLAGQPGVRASWGAGFTEYVRHNIDATQRLLEAAADQSVARVIFASSSSVYGDVPLPMREDGPLRPISPYGITKLTGEHLCRVYSSRVEVVPLRFFTVVGPRQRPDMAFHRFITNIARGTPFPVFGDGTQTRDFTFVDDVVRIVVAAAERAEPGVPMNVAGGNSASVLDVIHKIEALVGRKAIPEFVAVPPGDPRQTLAATDRLDKLGVAGRVNLDDGLARQVRWVVDLLHDEAPPTAAASAARAE